MDVGWVVNVTFSLSCLGSRCSFPPSLFLCIIYLSHARIPTHYRPPSCPPHQLGGKGSAQDEPRRKERAAAEDIAGRPPQPTDPHVVDEEPDADGDANAQGEGAHGDWEHPLDLTTLRGQGFCAFTLTPTMVRTR